MLRRGLVVSLALLPARAWAAETPVAVTSFSLLSDFTRRIAGGAMRVASLVPADADAHVYQPTAADSRTLAAARILIENGLGFEGWLSRLGEAAGFKGTKIVATAGITPRRMPDGTATAIDPHAWQNPRNGIRYVRNIAEGLAAADPANAAAYRANAAKFVADIERMDAWIEAQYAAIPAPLRRIVTTHDAFGYYGDRFGIVFLAAEGLATDSEPSAKSIAALVAQIKREKVRTVFLENMTDPRISKMLARETGASLSGPLFSDSLSKPGGPAADYLSMLKHNTTLMARAMRPA